MKEHKLPSGAMLRFELAPFKESRALYQSILREVKEVRLDDKDELNMDLFKNIFCTLLSSEEIEKCIFVCMEKSLYNNFKITEESFEPEEARQDYLECLMTVAWENILPFGKALFAEYAPIIAKVKKGLTSKSEATNS